MKYLDIKTEQTEHYFCKVESKWAGFVPKNCLGFGSWQIRFSIHPEDVPLAFETLAPSLIKLNIFFRVALPSAIDINSNVFDPNHNCFFVIRPNLKKQAESLLLLDFLESRLKDSKIRPGGTLFSDRQIVGSQYMSYRNDEGIKDEFEPLIDYNAHGHGGPLYGVSLDYGIKKVDPENALKIITGPDCDVEEIDNGFLLTLPTLSAVSLRKVLNAFSIVSNMGYIDNNLCVSLDKTSAQNLSKRWFEAREMLDTFRVNIALKMNLAVKFRSSDSSSPSLTMEIPPAKAEMLGKLGSFGFVIEETNIWNLPIYGRVFADFIVANLKNSGEARTEGPLYIEKEIIDENFEKKINIRRLDKNLLSMAAAFVIKNRKNNVNEKDEKQIKKEENTLNKAGIKEISVMHITERLFKDREQEIGKGHDENPKEMLREISEILNIVSRIDGIPSSSKAEARGAHLGIERLINRPDLTIGRAFEGVKRSQGVMQSISNHMKKLPGEESKSISQIVDSMKYRIEARVAGGPPKVKLNLTEKEAVRMTS